MQAVSRRFDVRRDESTWWTIKGSEHGSLATESDLKMSTHQPDDRDANRVIVLEGTPLGTPVAKSFASADEAEAFVVTRVRAHVLVDQRDRLERAVADRIVSEDGMQATSEVIAGKLAFLRALAKAYAPTRITITARRFDDDDDARR